MTTALAVVPTSSSTDPAFEPRSIDEALKLAGLLVASRLLPKSVGTPEAAFAIIATGRELGLTVMQSLRSIHVIEGKPTLSADLVCALVKKHKACKFFRLVESTDKIATYETLRVGEPTPTKLSFTIEQAQRAGVASKDNWRKWPEAMLRARCIMALARAVYPDATLGVYDPDELAPGSSAPVQHVPPEPISSVSVTEDGEIIDDAQEPGPSNAAKSFEVAIASASDLAALKLVGEAIAESQLPTSDTLFLSPIYSTRMKALKAIR